MKEHGKQPLTTEPGCFDGEADFNASEKRLKWVVSLVKRRQPPATHSAVAVALQKPCRRAAAVVYLGRLSSVTAGRVAVLAALAPVPMSLPP